MKIIIIIIALISSNVSYCQNHNLNFGMQFGRSSLFGDGGIVLGYMYKKKIELNTGLGVSKYRSINSGLELNYTPFYKESGLRPILGVAYNYNFKSRNNIGEDNDNIGTYDVAKQNFLIPSIGIRKDYFIEDKNGFMSFRFYVSYRIPLNENKVTFIKGVQSNKIQNDIQNKINENIGIGVRILFVID